MAAGVMTKLHDMGPIYDEPQGGEEMCAVIGLDHSATWNGSADLSHLAGKAIKLRILLEKARIYSFWCN